MFSFVTSLEPLSSIYWERRLDCLSVNVWVKRVNKIRVGSSYAEHWKEGCIDILYDTITKGKNFIWRKLKKNEFPVWFVTFLIDGTISSKINVTPKGDRLSEKLQHSVMKFYRGNKFDYVIMGKWTRYG